MLISLRPGCQGQRTVKDLARIGALTTFSRSKRTFDASLQVYNFVIYCFCSILVVLIVFRLLIHVCTQPQWLGWKFIGKIVGMTNRVEALKSSLSKIGRLYRTSTMSGLDLGSYVSSQSCSFSQHGTEEHLFCCKTRKCYHISHY